MKRYPLICFIPSTRSRSQNFVPSVLHTLLTPSPPFFTRSFLYSSPSPSNAAGSNRTLPQRLLTIDLQRTRSIYNGAATSRTTKNEQTSPLFKSSLKYCLTLSISHSYISIFCINFCQIIKKIFCDRNNNNSVKKINYVIYDNFCVISWFGKYCICDNFWLLNVPNFCIFPYGRYFFCCCWNRANAGLEMLILAVW